MQTPPANPDGAPRDPHSAAAEHGFHRYVGNHIPWYVYLLWSVFWIFAILYILVYQFPIIATEIVNPP